MRLVHFMQGGCYLLMHGYGFLLNRMHDQPNTSDTYPKAGGTNHKSCHQEMVLMRTCPAHTCWIFLKDVRNSYLLFLLYICDISSTSKIYILKTWIYIYIYAATVFSSYDISYVGASASWKKDKSRFGRFLACSSWNRGNESTKLAQ